MRLYIAFFFSFFAAISSFGQIIEGQDTLYGNEWINYDQQYFKMLVAEDGIYKVTGQELQNAGVPISTITGNSYQVFHNGKEIPIYTSTDQPFQPDDYLLFYGEKNRSELDRYLFKNPDEEMMNPRYSLITDSAAYFVTWTLSGTGMRYSELENDLSNVSEKTEWCLFHDELIFTDRLKKEADAHGIAKSNYTRAEGYATNWANSQTHTINFESPFIGGQNAEMNLRYSGNLGSHQLEISLNGQVEVVDEFNDYEVKETSVSIDGNILGGPVQIGLSGLVSNNDKHRLAYISYTYPRSLEEINVDYFAFSLPESQTDYYLELDGFVNGDQMLLINKTASYFIRPSFENGKLKINTPATAEVNEYLLFNAVSGSMQNTQLHPVNFVDLSNQNAQYIIISNKKLYDDGTGQNLVQAYADYRSTSQGGSYSTIVLEIQDLYDQFAWGINRHPLSIRNFVWWAKKNWSDPQYVLLIGKGLEYYRVRSESSLASATQFYLPTWGTPGSDNLLVAGPNGYTPLIPVGRIACWNTDDLRIYFDKVKQFESQVNAPQTIQGRLWMKNVLHLGGGNAANPGEQQLIKNYLKSFENILAESRFGTHTMSYYKTSTDPIQQPQTNLIFDYINNGVSLVTFFGHSGLGAFDLSIDFPENYHNKDKYYWMLSLGCYAGNIHTSSRGIGERFVFMEEAGPIAFTATAGQGFISSLGTYVSKLYDLLGNSMYGQGIGNILQATNGNFSEGNFGIDLIRQQFNTLGDPAIRLNPSPGPDYVVDPARVNLKPERISVNLGELEFQLTLANLGQNLGDSVALYIEHQLPNGTRQPIIDTLLLAPAYNDEFMFKFPSPGKEAIGQNTLFVTVDAGNRVDELPLPVAESNNELVMPDGRKGFSFFVRDNSAVPVYPPAFAIVDRTDLTLKAYTTDPLAPERRYLFQLDTTENFNSPVLLTHTLTRNGGILKWTPSMDWEPDKVYFWRVSPDSLSPQEGFLWAGSSFIIEPDGGAGWNQSHGQQFQKNNMVNLEVDDDGKWSFPESLKEYILTNAAANVKRPGLLLNNYTSWNFYYSLAAGYYITWIDSVYLEPIWNRYPNQIGLQHPWGLDATVFMFRADELGRKQAMDFLTNVIPEGDYVLFSTVQNSPTANYRPDEWLTDSLTYGYSLLNILENDGGAQLARQLPTTGSVPYAVAYRKGYGLIGEKMASASNEIIELKFVLEGNWDRGYLTTNPIGPASQWGKITSQHALSDQTPSDTVLLEVFGVRPDDSRTLLMNHTLLQEDDIDISSIDAGQFSRIALKIYAEDSLFRTAPQLRELKVYFTGAPEYAFDPGTLYELNSDSLQQGASLDLRVAIENIMPVDATDSLLIEYRMSNASNGVTSTKETQPPLQSEEQRIVHFTYDTRSQKGPHSLGVELNADRKPEWLYLNNFLDLGYQVYADQLNPSVDVTFDGRRILDGELVSARPHIRVRLKDENPFLLLNDTSLIRLAILWPDSVNYAPLYFNAPGISWEFSGDPGDNYLLVNYEPTFDRDGVYTLVVQAADLSGNASGGIDFKQRFRIMTKRAISNFVNYPNPFSTSTRFVYTLTGDKPPTDYRLQIMTVSGRIVREVSKEELGPLHVGTHMTDFAWDGKDQYGAQLATGVYLYRLLFSEDDELKSLETAVDRFTTGGVGKMVLIR